MPRTISRVVGVIEIDQASAEITSRITGQLQVPSLTDQVPSLTDRETSVRPQRAKLGGVVPTIRLDANIKRLLGQLEDELEIVERCLNRSLQTTRS